MTAYYDSLINGHDARNFISKILAVLSLFASATTASGQTIGEAATAAANSNASGTHYSTVQGLAGGTGLSGSLSILDYGGSLNAAVTALAGGPGTIFVPPNYTGSLTGTLTLAANENIVFEGPAAINQLGYAIYIPMGASHASITSLLPQTQIRSLAAGGVKLAYTGNNSAICVGGGTAACTGAISGQTFNPTISGVSVDISGAGAAAIGTTFVGTFGAVFKNLTYILANSPTTITQAGVVFNGLNGAYINDFGLGENVTVWNGPYGFRSMGQNNLMWCNMCNHSGASNSFGYWSGLHSYGLDKTGETSSSSWFFRGEINGDDFAVGLGRGTTSDHYEIYSEQSGAQYDFGEATTGGGNVGIVLTRAPRVNAPNISTSTDSFYQAGAIRASNVTIPNGGAITSYDSLGNANRIVGANGGGYVEIGSIDRPQAVQLAVNGVAVATLPANGSGVTVAGAILSSGSGGIGYTAGSGGTVVQAASKTTSVTLNAPSGSIMLNGSAMAASSPASFTLNDAAIQPNDTFSWSLSGNYTTGAYAIAFEKLSSGAATVTVRNLTAGSLAERPVINFAIIHGSPS